MKLFILRIFLVSLILFDLKVNAQQDYFNKRYNVDYSEDSYSVLQYGERYVIATASHSIGSNVKISLTAFDSIGTLLWTKYVQSSTNNYFSGSMGSLVQKTDGGFALAGTFYNNTGEDYAIFYSFNNNGDTVWTVSYGDTSYQKFNQVKQTLDGGFILVGTTATHDIWHDVWLVKTDSLGNLEWENHYGLPNVLEEGLSVIQTRDGGYFLGGERFDLPTENGDWLLMKTDSVGNLQWEKLFGGTYEEYCFSVLQAQDGSLVGGGYYTVFCLGPHNGSPFCQPNIIKLDTAGNLLWDKKYGPVKYATVLTSICETTDGGFVGAGSFYVDDDTSSFQFQGIVIKANTQGDSLWYRNYTYLPAHSDNVLYDIRTTTDGGFIASGLIDPALPDNGYMDTWLLKLDSNGCEVINCWLGTALNEFSFSDEIIIHPNPTGGEFYINLPAYEIREIEIFNLTGECIYKSEELMSSIDLRMQPAGLYFCIIYTREGKIYRNKLLKE